MDGGDEGMANDANDNAHLIATALPLIKNNGFTPHHSRTDEPRTCK